MRTIDVDFTTPKGITILETAAGPHLPLPTPYLPAMMEAAIDIFWDLPLKVLAQRYDASDVIGIVYYGDEHQMYRDGISALERQLRRKLKNVAGVREITIQVKDIENLSDRDWWYQEIGKLPGRPMTRERLESFFRLSHGL